VTDLAALLSSLALSLQAGAPAGTVLHSGPGHVKQTAVGHCYVVRNWYDKQIRVPRFNPSGSFYVITRSRASC
jgi:hypothetical protein